LHLRHTAALNSSCGVDDPVTRSVSAIEAVKPQSPRVGRPSRAIDFERHASLIQLITTDKTYASEHGEAFLMSARDSMMRPVYYVKSSV